jgi:hypothetical protein
MQNLTRHRILPGVARILGPALAVRDDRRDRTSDPERVKPLVSLDIPSVGSRTRTELIRLPILPGFVLPRLAPSFAPPGHS